MKGLDEVMNALRRVPTTGGVSSMGALGDIAQRISTAMPQAPTVPAIGNAAAEAPEVPAEAVPALPKPKVDTVGGRQVFGLRTVVARLGASASKWSNPCISAAIPALLLLHHEEAAQHTFDAEKRRQLGLEVRMFRETLGSSGLAPGWVDDASYLLCTHIDEVVNEWCRSCGAPLPEMSLLVEFHGDAWGGEDCFVKLEKAMAEEKPPMQLLEFYELILGLGFKGRYQIMDRGAILLQDRRSELHRLIWQKEPAGLALRADAPQRFKKRWLTPLRLFLLGLLCLLAAYLAGVLDIASRGSPLRQALAAYEPPVREMNLYEVLPPPLPELIAEGWLTAERREKGWLLVFRSDGAFEAGKAEIRPDFLSNLNRLGQAFAPWPGDLEVIGHTDLTPIVSSGFGSNQALSEARATRVADLIRQQVQTTAAGAKSYPSRQVTATGMGEREPVTQGTSKAANMKNRRVEILWKVVGLKKVVGE
jgi:type VI secretion system protein ImpK